MKAEIKWVEKRTFLGISGSGFTLPFGTASGEDGIRAGPTAMELVLIGTGGCSAWDVVQILEKGRENIADCVVELDAERAEDDPGCVETLAEFRYDGRAGLDGWFFGFGYLSG